MKIRIFTRNNVRVKGNVTLPKLGLRRGHSILVGGEEKIVHDICWIQGDDLVDVTIK